MVEGAGARVLRRLERGDHERFSPAELDAAASGAEAIVLSRKDLVKLGEMPKTTVLVPELRIRFVEGEERVRVAIAACVSARGARSSA